MRHIIALALAWISLTASAAPTVEFTDKGLAISGLTPSGSAAYLSVSLEPSSVLTRVVPRDGIVGPVAGDGSASVDVGTIPALRSVWLVVDLPTGEWTVATPEGFTSPVIEPGGRVGRARGLLPALDVLEIARNELEILIVRPGQGVWRLSAIEGGPADDDRVNDRVLSVRIGSARPLASSPEAPRVLSAGDVIIAIDPEELSHFVASIGR